LGIALLAARSMTSDLQADTEARGQVLDLIRNSQPVGIALVATVIVAAADVETPPALSVALAVIEYAPAATPLHAAV